MLAECSPDSVVVFGDDGEKFGTWPNTKKHVYEDGWLEKFFTALSDNKDWLKTSTLNEAVQSTPPRGKVYLPDASYREMTEWSLPVNRQVEHDELVWRMIRAGSRFSHFSAAVSGEISKSNILSPTRCILG